MSIQARLKKAMHRGNLTVADLARWFDCPYPTVRSWVLNGVRIGGGPRDIEHIDRRLNKLESLIIQNSGKFPVPRMAPSERIKYLRKLAVF